MNDGRIITVAKAHLNPRIRVKEFRMTKEERESPEGKSFRSVLGRANASYQKRHTHYKGVTVCDRWLHPVSGFDNFLKDMGKCPDTKQRWTVDRIDNSKGYEPSNCRWSTYKENSNNKRNNRYIKYKGEIKTMTQWAETYDLKVSTLWWRLNQGWEFEEALLSPTKNTK